MPTVSTFKRKINEFYRSHGRHDLPWRKTRDPYKILVSEVMLQQTQVDRVVPKYKSFLKKFPTLHALARASNKEVLTEWQGLGYNRRALNLKRAAEKIERNFNGNFPTSFEPLMALPGIGKATAGDLLAFAYNLPTIVIETNIRTVFIHHFFKDKKKVSDADIIPLIEKTIDEENPRDWYYALMDYGSYLKKTLGNNIQQSKHYKKQSSFKGSNRELRSKILKLILKKSRTKEEILKLLDSPSPAIKKNLLALESEGLIKKRGLRYTA